MIIGVDQGTTSTRAVLMDSDLKVHHSAQIEHRQIYPKPGWVEHDAEELWHNLRALMIEMAESATAPVEGVGLSNQGETVVAWDRETKKPSAPAIVWQDERTLEFCQTLSAHRESISKKTGLPLDPYFSASKLRWYVDHLPTRPTALGTSDSYFIDRLTGDFITDVSTAARTSLFNLHEHHWGEEKWDEELCRWFGVSGLAEIKPSYGQPLATIKDFHPALDGKPILASAVDQPAALFGHGGLAVGEAKATFGTGCFLYLNTGNDFIAPMGGLISTLAWQGRGAPTYALEGGVFTAASAIEWAKSIGIFTDDSEIDPLLSQVMNSEIASSVLAIPSFAGLSAPYWNREAKASITGMGLNTSRAEILYALYEGIALHVAQLLDALSAQSGNPIRTLKVDGGMTRSKNFMQLLADTIGLEIRIPERDEATVLGITAMAGITAGWFDEREYLKKLTATNPYSSVHPRTTADARSARHRVFEDQIEKLYPKAKNV